MLKLLFYPDQQRSLKEKMSLQFTFFCKADSKCTTWSATVAHKKIDQWSLLQPTVFA